MTTFSLNWALEKIKTPSVEEQSRFKIPFREDLHVLKTPIVANVAEAGCATRS